jgi:ABC-2 type transport system ATP-binding protein
MVDAGDDTERATQTSDGLVLEATGLRRSFGDLVAVNGVDVRIAPKETYGLLGPNGAGKTTTISMIAGLLEPDAGRVTVAGQPLSTRSVKTKQAIGLVPQEIAVYPDLTGRENLRFFGKLYGMTGRALDTRVGEVLDVVGLTDRAGDPTKEYSGGMQRRLNIGIGLLHRPRLLILDEPTVGVDPQSRNAILESVELLAREGMAVLYTTHYMEEAERLCDRVGIIDQGEVKAEGTRRELVALVGEHDRILLAANGDLEAAATAAGQLDGVASTSATSGGMEVVATDAGPLLPSLLARVAEAGAQVTGVEVTQPDLESVFLHLTGKALRD